MDATALDSQLDQLDTTLGDARRVLLGVETAGCDVQQLARVRKLVLGFRNTLDAINADLAQRAGELRQGGSSKPTDDAMNPDHRQSPAAEHTERDRGGVYGQLPGLEDATKSGELSGRYGDIIARAVRNLNSDVRAEFYRRHTDLADVAKTMTEHRFRLHIQALVEQVLADSGVERTTRQRRNRTAKIWNDIDSGMWNLRGSWDPDTGATINTNLDAEINALYRTTREDPNDTRTRPQLLADAITNLLCGTPTHNTTRTGRNGGATVLVITDQHTANHVSKQDRTTTSSGTGHRDAAAPPEPPTNRTTLASSDLEASAAPPERPVNAPRDTTGTTDEQFERNGAAATTPTPNATAEHATNTAEHATNTGADPPEAIETPKRPSPIHEYSDGTPIALRSLRRLLTDRDIITLPVTANEHGVVTAIGDEQLDHGRERRLASWAQRFALRAMHRTCLIGGCDTPFNRCEIHHLTDWEHQGHTDLANLAPLCVRHHHLVHAEGWTLQLDPATRQLTIAHSDGTTEVQPFVGLQTGSGNDAPVGSTGPDDDDNNGDGVEHPDRPDGTAPDRSPGRRPSDPVRPSVRIPEAPPGRRPSDGRAPADRTSSNGGQHRGRHPNARTTAA